MSELGVIIGVANVSSSLVLHSLPHATVVAWSLEMPYRRSSAVWIPLTNRARVQPSKFLQVS